MTSIVDCFGAPSVPVSASQSIRRWDHGLLAGVAGALVGMGLTAWALWRPLPGLPVVPDGGGFTQLLEYPALLANAISGGWLCPHAWVDNPAADQVGELALHLRLLPAWLAGAVSGGWSLRQGLVPHPMTRHVSGPRLLRGLEAEQAAATTAMQARGGPDATGFLRLHPRMDLPKRTWCRHVLVHGSVGSGKTQIIYPICRRVIRQKKKLFLLDVKGDYTAAIKRGLILSPWDRRSGYWDIARDVRTAAQAATFASTMVPSEGGNKFFSTAAEMILTGCLRALQKHGGSTWTWADLNALLGQSSEELAAVLAQHHARAQPLLEGGEITTGSVMASLTAYTQTIAQLAEAFGDGRDEEGQPRPKISLVQWCRDDHAGNPTIIAHTGPDPGLTQRYLAAAVNILVPEILRLPDDTDEGGRFIAVVLDELASIGKANLAPLIDKGRSKGVSVIVGCQDLANQVAEVHGEHFARALPGMVGTHIIGQVQIGPTRTAISESFGKRCVAITTFDGEHAKPSVKEEWQPVVQPTALTSMLGRRTGKRFPHGFGIRAIAALGDDLIVLEWPGFPLPKSRRPFVPARWTLPDTEQGSQPSTNSAPSRQGEDWQRLVDDTCASVRQGLATGSSP